MGLLLMSLLLVLGAAFAATAATNGADSRDFNADSYNVPHGGGLN
jgi:hypothetical protein